MPEEREKPKTAWERRLARFRRDQERYAREMRKLARADSTLEEEEPFIRLMKRAGRI